MTLITIIENAREKGVKEEDLIDEIWETAETTVTKIIMSLQLYDMQPTYQVLTTMWRNYSITTDMSKEITDMILKKYGEELSQPQKNSADSMEYSFYFDIFEDPERNENAWLYFLDQHPSDHFLKIILANSGPIPYYLKQALYKKLIHHPDFHADIYRSIRHSCFDNCGLVDRAKALQVLSQLRLDDQMTEINSEIGCRKYEDVLNYLQKTNA